MTFKFGVIGCGRMGKKRINRIVNHQDTKLTAVVDVIGEKAKKTGEKYNVPFFPDIDEMFNKKDIDNLVICTPNKFHAEIAEKALKKDINVFCEKPLARSPEEAKKMVKAEIKSKGSLKVGSNLRYFRSVKKAKELVSEYAIGGPIHLRGWIGNSGWQLDKSWYTNPELIGGGTLLDNGVHLLDISRWFLGEVEECSGFTFNAVHELESSLEDNALGLFKFKDDKHAFIQSSWTEWADYMYMEIYGEEGYLRIDNRNPNSKVIYGKSKGIEKIYNFSKLPPQSYDFEFQEYIENLNEGNYPKPTGFDGLRSIQMAYGIYESETKGEKVKIWGNEEKDLLRTFKKNRGIDR